MANARPDGQTLNSINISFMSSLWAVKPGTLEETVQILWNCILNTWFPPTQPYKIGIKAAVLTDDSAPDAVVFEIRFNNVPRDSHELVERQIFMVECKRMNRDTPAGWRDAQIQLQAYLEANINPNTSSNGMYGACAIGRKVVFYEWTRASGQLNPISGTLDMSVADQRPSVEDALSYIKQYGWNRAN